MPAKIYYDNDADLSLLKGKTIAIIGYGSQGHAQAQNLRDSGCTVIVGQRPGGPNYDLAVSHGFKPVQRGRGDQEGRPGQHPAARRSAGGRLPAIDQAQPEAGQPADVLARVQRPLRPGRGAAGRRYRCWSRPRAPATWCAASSCSGGGVPCLIALSPGASEQSKKLGLAYAKGIGGTRGGVIETTFAEETETDLFGEQVVLCGGVSALVKAAFETLVEAGYQPEMAYFECMHELKLIVDLFYQGGLNYMRYSVSNTAEYGDYTRGPRIVTDETKAEMKKILNEIQSGQFAREWILENKANAPAFKATRRRERRARPRRSRPAAAAADDVDQGQGSVGQVFNAVASIDSPGHNADATRTCPPPPNWPAASSSRSSSPATGSRWSTR